MTWWVLVGGEFAWRICVVKAPLHRHEYVGVHESQSALHDDQSTVEVAVDTATFEGAMADAEMRMASAQRWRDNLSGREVNHGSRDAI